MCKPGELAVNGMGGKGAQKWTPKDQEKVNNEVYLTKKLEKQGVTGVPGRREIGRNSVIIKVKQKAEHYQNKRQTENSTLK